MQLRRASRATALHMRAARVPALESASPALPAPHSPPPPTPIWQPQMGSPQHAAPTTSQQGASSENMTHTAREEVRRLIELARSSQGGPTGFEGVYSAGAGFGAELRKGAKRLRQTGFHSPFEAALERARWAKLADLRL